MIRTLVAAVLLLSACSSAGVGTASAEPTAEVTAEPTQAEPTQAETPTAMPDSSPTPTLEPTPEVTAQCDQAFAQAASIGDMEDTVEDLYPAVTACTSIEDWIAGSEANPGALSEAVRPLMFLGNVCGSLNAGLENTDLCQLLRALCDTDDDVSMTMACLEE